MPFSKEQEELYTPAKKAGGRQELPGKTEQNCKCQRHNEQGNSFSISDGSSASGSAAVIQ